MGAWRQSGWTCPFAPDLPPVSARWHRPARWARLTGYFLFFGALTTACVQFHVKTARNQARGAGADRAYRDALAVFEAEPSEDNRREAMAAAEKVARVKRHKGALGRWLVAVPQFWSGRNIYQPVRGAGAGDPLTGQPLPGAGVPPNPPPRLGATTEEITDTDAWLHPNMPFVVILLTPLAHVPVQAAVAMWNLLKLLALLAAIFAAAAVSDDGRHRTAEWVVGLAALFTLPLILGDLQHGNSNLLVLGALAGHLWLHRRGRDLWAGSLLALAICLKMTPALFAAYWLYQRNWRLLAALAGALAVMVVLIPLAALGPGRYDLLMGSWLGNLIVPGLLKGAPYPIHINQSLSGVFSRLLMRGNIYFNPDDVAVADKFGYVNLASLGPATGRYVLLGVKGALVGVMAWAIGWRKLARDDGRRALHYGLLAAGMLILNQRSWDHHAGILLLAYLPIWYALAYGRMGRGRRIFCLVGVALAALLLIGMSGSLYPEELGDVLDAYGPTFAHFVIVLVVCIVLLRGLAASAAGGGQAYARTRQPV